MKAQKRFIWKRLQAQIQAIFLVPLQGYSVDWSQRRLRGGPQAGSQYQNFLFLLLRIKYFIKNSSVFDGSISRKCAETGGLLDVLNWLLPSSNVMFVRERGPTLKNI
jgi:hypothetical protein